MSCRAPSVSRSTARSRGSRVQQEQTGLRAALEALPEPPEIIVLHPAAPGRCEGQLADVRLALDKHIRSGDTEAARALRDPVDTGTGSRDPVRKGGLDAKFAGRLDRLPGPGDFPQYVKGAWRAMVAEGRYRRSPRRDEGRFSIALWRGFRRE